MDRPELNWVGVGAGLAVASQALPLLSAAGLSGDLLRLAVGVVWLAVIPIASGATGAIHWVGRQPGGEAYGIVLAAPLAVIEVARRAGVLAVSEWMITVAAVGAVLGGFAASVAATHTYAVEMSEGETPAAVWQTRSSRKRRWLSVGVGIALLASPVVVVLLWAAEVLPSLPIGTWSSLAVFPVTMGIVLAVNSRRTAEYEAYDSGIRLTYSGAIVSTFLPADRIAGCTLDDDALVIQFHVWWLSDRHCARSDLDDAEAISAAIGRYGEQVQKIQAPAV